LPVTSFIVHLTKESTAPDVAVHAALHGASPVFLPLRGRGVCHP
jgi:hypothetical protein